MELEHELKYPPSHVLSPASDAVKSEEELDDGATIHVGICILMATRKWRLGCLPVFSDLHRGSRLGLMSSAWRSTGSVLQQAPSIAFWEFKQSFDHDLQHCALSSSINTRIQGLLRQFHSFLAPGMQ